MLDILTSLGWDAARADELAPFGDTHVPARVVRVDRAAVEVLTADNPLRVPTAAGDEQLVVGDWVLLAAIDRDWRVDAILTRRTEIRRGSVTGRSAAQVLAANVDLAVVVVPAVPAPRVGMTERLVALAWDSGARPLVVVTKADLCPDAEELAAQVAASAPGVDVVTVSSADPAGYAALAPHLTAGLTCCLLGRSGAGKSTLANALLGADRFATTAIRADGKGRHTTARRELVVLPGGAVLIDTPGLRGVALWLDEEGLDQAFADVTELAADCRFTDCEHRSEPGCAVTAAVEDGSLPRRRLDSWRKLEREAAWMARRHDARLRAEEARRWKARAREARGRTRP